jgi:hypothetical protein
VTSLLVSLLSELVDEVVLLLLPPELLDELLELLELLDLDLEPNTLPPPPWE